ncbi:putative 3D-(3,5/4)-trihydroxycyclohexane-1,2-dione acylhydrolase (decyclizing) [Vibrio virus VPMCC5]|nr:putative 3D-(3,5/4)-trihydroxycyclohexane-1,2-dione acylhydrolase (decyclizing) [Vibrio virus VPMCC5]
MVRWNYFNVAGYLVHFEEIDVPKDLTLDQQWHYTRGYLDAVAKNNPSLFAGKGVWKKEGV